MTRSKEPQARDRPPAAAPAARARSPHSGPLRDLVTMKMIILFGLLRRGGALAQRRHFDLSELEWRVMGQIAFRPQSLTGLAELLVLDRGQLSRTVKAMVERGLLTRDRKPGGPEIVIGLSQQGEALHERMVDWAFERDGALTGDIAPDDIARLGDALEHMIGKARVLLEEERQLENAPDKGKQA